MLATPAALAGGVFVIDATTLEVRPAGQADAPAINVLLHGLGYPSNTDASPPPVRSTSPSLAYLELDPPTAGLLRM